MELADISDLKSLGETHTSSTLVPRTIFKRKEINMCNCHSEGNMCKGCEETLPKPVSHVHAELIKAWANNSALEFEVFDKVSTRWIHCDNPSWYKTNLYRIKPPPPKPIIMYGHMEFKSPCSPRYHGSIKFGYGGEKGNTNWGNLKFTFDPETNKLLSVEMI